MRTICKLQIGWCLIVSVSLSLNRLVDVWLYLCDRPYKDWLMFDCVCFTVFVQTDWCLTVSVCYCLCIDWLMFDSLCVWDCLCIDWLMFDCLFDCLSTDWLMFDCVCVTVSGQTGWCLTVSVWLYLCRATTSSRRCLQMSTGLLSDPWSMLSCPQTWQSTSSKLILSLLPAPHRET